MGTPTIRSPLVQGAWLPHAAIGVTLGLGCGSLLVGGWVTETLFALALIPALLGLVRLLEPPRERGAVIALVLVAFGIRLVAIAALQLGSIARGMEGFITGDDREYYTLSWAFVQYLRDQPQPPYVPPYWAGSAYLFGAWVYLESALLWIVGPRVIVPIVLNAAMSVASALLIGDMARSLFGDRVGRVARFCVAFYPSIVLWSALNLKDTLTLLLITLTMWSLLRFARRPSWWALTLALSLLIPLQTLRSYIFTGLAIIVPLAVLVAPRLSLRARAVWGVPALIACAGLMVANQVGVSATSLLASSEVMRRGMAVGARTAFQPTPTPRPLIFSMVAPTLTPEPEPQSTDLPPVATGGSIGEAPVVSGARPLATVAPTQAPRPARTVRPIPVSVRFEPVVPPPRVTAAPEATGPTGQDLTLRTIAYLPKGAVYALFAPWPWLGSRATDLLTAPEMLFWYVALVAMLAALWTERRSWRVLLPIALFAFGTLGVFAIVEGNWGTLYRHRAMSIPFVIVLAAPTLLTWASGLRRVGPVSPPWAAP